MGESKCVYTARFVGRKHVEGPLNDYRLSAEVAGFYAGPPDAVQGDTGPGLQDEIRCHVEFTDKNLVVTFTKKDEGFESDADSFKSLSVENQKLSMSEEKPISSDEKIIQDHVFRPGVEDSFSSGSLGSDSETSDHNKSSSGVSSASITPTAELVKFKFDHVETYNISDVLICHTDRLYKNCVFLVVRKFGSLETIVFECATEDNAKQLYKKFHEVSKRSRLERHRRRKSDGGSIVTRVSDYTANEGGVTNHSINNTNINIIERAVEKNHQKWNLVQHTDKNGMTHIEVESAEKPLKNNPNLVNIRNNSSDILTFTPQQKPSNNPKRKSQDRSKFAKELEGILSMSGSGAKTPVDMKTEPVNQRQARSIGEPLSLRQRAPAMLLKKLEEFDDKANKIWSKAELNEENARIWNKSSRSTIGISSNPGPRLEQNQSENNVLKYEPNHPKSSGKNLLPSEKDEGSSKNAKKDSKKDSENCILVPTKTGKEPAKKMYPKESPAMGHVHSRYFPVSMGLTQPHSLPIFPIRISPGLTWSHPRGPPDNFSQLDIPGSMWRGPTPDTTSLWSRGPAPPKMKLQSELQTRSRSRDRSRIDSEHRRRAQSKSPARNNQSVLATPDISNISKMFRDFGGAMRAKMSKKNSDPKMAIIPDSLDATCLKSNLKKQKSNGDLEDESLSPDKNKLFSTTMADNKKVHFNKFATVQMME